MGALHESRRITQFECPNLSEKPGEQTTAEIAVKWWSNGFLIQARVVAPVFTVLHSIADGR